MGSERDKLREGTKSDTSLATWRTLADMKSKGFKWKDGLVFLTVMVPTFRSLEVLVLPKSFRAKVLRTAHDGTGHLGHRKVLQLVKRKFDWPLLARDVTVYY